MTEVSDSILAYIVSLLDNESLLKVAQKLKPDDRLFRFVDYELTRRIHPDDWRGQAPPT